MNLDWIIYMLKLLLCVCDFNVKKGPLSNEMLLILFRYLYFTSNEHLLRFETSKLILSFVAINYGRGRSGDGFRMPFANDPLVNLNEEQASLLST
jgi:hypothetical protein